MEEHTDIMIRTEETAMHEDEPRTVEGISSPRRIFCVRARCTASSESMVRRRGGPPRIESQVADVIDLCSRVVPRVRMITTF